MGRTSTVAFLLLDPMFQQTLADEKSTHESRTMNMAKPVNSDPRTAGYQSWKKLTFLHWRIAAEKLQPLVPAGLTIEQFDGSAWLGLVPFSMERVRPWWFCAVPGVSWFLETNIRTYVVDQRGVRGVWFFSLDANNQLAVSVARGFWHLPYKMAHLSLNSSTDSADQMRVNYAGHRIDSPAADYEVSVDVSLASSATTATPETLDHFLLERYILFAQHSSGRFMTGEVHHDPYRIRVVNSFSVTQSLTAAMGCALESVAVDHVAYSDGVDVRVSPLEII